MDRGSPGPVSAPEGVGAAERAEPDAVLNDLAQLRAEFSRFMLQYQFGVDEITTKIGILREEFRLLRDYNPIEHVTSRVKTPESIINKIARKGCDPSFDAIRASITDIAGVRVTCSFTSDVYRLAEMLTSQADLTLLEVKDYIAEPKPNGYRSLHVLVEVPVFLSTGPVPVIVELQIRTIAMDFWASLEHKIFYKYRDAAPAGVRERLAEAAETAHQLDTVMEDLHRQVHTDVDSPGSSDNRLVPSDEVLERLAIIRSRLDTES